ncbi:MAG TPA: prolipoprotein diacylglyceryl transferase [Cyclobacteriaceae bacterium]|nr:prolipoprotein diacylglyceryl transferase [Cyclobacteriaceae bacterium]
MTSYIIWDISPEIFERVKFFRWYGLFWAFGLIGGQWIMFRIYKREGVPGGEVDKLTLYILLGAIVGARIGHILFYDPMYYLHNPVEILPVKLDPTFEFTGLSGLASHGGVLGGLLALYIYNRKFERGYLWLLDRLIIAGSVLGGFIRLGNLMNSEIIGIPSNLPWAFVFANVDQVPRHPAQLYEAVFYFLVSILLYLAWRSGKFYHANGFIFGLGITLIFAQRFFIEFLKADQVPFEAGMMLNMGQILSVPLVVVGVVVMVRSRLNSKVNT